MAMLKYLKISICLIPLILVACQASEEENTAAKSKTTPAASQAMTVQAVTVRKHNVPNIIELPGRVEPVRQAEVRARVTGIVQNRLYEEGTDVTEGQALFNIDPREVKANLAQVKASLQRAEATAANAQAVVDRFENLVELQAISQQEYDSAVAASREAEASVIQIKAQIDAANLQVGYTTVRAPIAGRARRANVTEGALVSASEATLMTQIEQLDPVYVTVAQASSKVLEIRRAIADGTIQLDENGQTKVELFFGDGTPYSEPGYVDFLDFSVNETTGTVNLRAEFPNPDNILLPGEFVHARFYVGSRRNGLSVPQSTVSIAESGASVFVVNTEGKVESKPVDLGPMDGQDWVIESGLSAGDQVITSNIQQLQPGTPVKVSSGSRSMPSSQETPSQAPNSAEDGNP
jgi:membrane fusion protein (multidrug efflux system)